MFDKNNLISIGLNNSSKENAKVKYFGDRFNVEQFKKFHYPHAEIDCISKAWSKYHITGKERLVVIRIGKAGDLLNSLPCSNCKTVLSALGFSSVWHSISGDVIESKL
jgi:cytidine deaminase